MEKTITMGLLEELVPIVFNKNWEISEQTTMSGLNEDKRRNVLIRLELWQDKQLVNFTQTSFELNEGIEGTVHAQIMDKLGKMKNDPTFLKNPMQ